MSLGIECLTTDDRGRALEIAKRLDDLNRERRAIESDMQAQAEEVLGKISVGETSSISLYDPGWHQGVVGILAGRVKDRYYRPTFAFAPSGPARSVARVARSRDCTFATRSTCSQSAHPGCCCALAATLRRRA